MNRPILGRCLLFGTACLLLFSSFASAQQPGQAEKAQPVFKDGMAQKVPAFSNSADWIQYDLWVETEFDTDGDGKKDRMHVDVTRQKQTDTEGLKVPVVYESSPYFSGVGAGDSKYFWDPKHKLGDKPAEHEVPPPIAHQSRRPLMSHDLIDQWVPLGYAVVHSASPGTGLSQGCPTVGGRNESLAPKAVIDWLNGRAKGFTTPDGNEEVFATWCTGKVGMTGTSYNGTLPLAAACTGVEGLKAIIPVAPNTSYYHYYRSNGLVRHPGGYMGEDVDVLYDFINSGNPEKRDHCNCEVRDKELKASADRLTGDYNEFWAGRDYLNQMGQMKAALFMAHGFNDWNVMPEHSYRIYQAAKEKGLPCKIYYHQMGHGGDPPFDMMNKWFTRFLYDVKNDVEKEPKALIVRENDRNTKPKEYADYPNPDASPVKFYPAGEGNKQGTLILEKAASATKPKIMDDVEISAADLAKLSESPTRLLFLTPPLKQEVHISGLAQLKIRLSSNVPAANLSVWLVALPWTDGGKITNNLITRGWADPQNHKALTGHPADKKLLVLSEPLVPGQFYDLTFDLQPDDQIIPAGKQIGLMIFSSDRDFTLWPPKGTELTVDLDSTVLTLPVVGGETKAKEAVR
ncbi:MAG: Xaa-Pro dipeptidyl-peptidase [Pirellulaceae bacterium]